MNCLEEKVEKRAAVPAESSKDENFAVSIRMSWQRISAMVDLGRPLRRPNRTTPLPTLQQELSAWDAASDEAWESIDD
jgi:hypothetical protein